MRKRLAVLALTGLLGACAASPRPSFHPPEPPQVFTQECDDQRVRFTLDRKQRAAPAYTVSITDLLGQPLAEEARVILAFTSMGNDRSTTTLVAQPTGNGSYTPPGGFLLTPGAWQVEVIIRQQDAREAVCVFRLDV